MRHLIVLLFSVLLAAGCTKKPPAPPEEHYLVHRVTYSGETLAIISRWYTGLSSNWRKIHAANPDLEPLKLQIGTAVRIPRNLVIRESPLPPRAVPGAKHTSHQDKAPAATEPSTAAVAPAASAVPTPESSAAATPVESPKAEETPIIIAASGAPTAAATPAETGHVPLPPEWKGYPTPDEKAVLPATPTAP
jgi:hypothetical protein